MDTIFMVDCWWYKVINPERILARILSCFWVLTKSCSIIWYLSCCSLHRAFVLTVYSVPIELILQHIRAIQSRSGKYAYIIPTLAYRMMGAVQQTIGVAKKVSCNQVWCMGKWVFCCFTPNLNVFMLKKNMDCTCDDTNNFWILDMLLSMRNWRGFHNFKNVRFFETSSSPGNLKKKKSPDCIVIPQPQLLWNRISCWRFVVGRNCGFHKDCGFLVLFLQDGGY